MNSRVITAVAFKLFAIWLIVQIVLRIPYAWQMYYLTKRYRADEAVETVFPYLLFISLIVCGFFAARVIYKLGDKVIAALPQGDGFFTPKDYETTLFQLLGAYFFVTAISIFPSAVIRAIQVDGKSPVSDWIWVVSLIFKMSIGIFLIAKARYFCDLMKKFR